jgi:phage gpG-like protein
VSALVVTIQGKDLAVVDRVMARLSPFDGMTLMEGLARLMQQQTRRRIEEEKTAPDGAPWKANRAGTSTLYKSGALSASIDYSASASRIELGSGLVYARIHQEGGVIRPKSGKALVFQAGNQMVFARQVTIPARPFIGVSKANGTEILMATVDFIRRKLG